MEGKGREERVEWWRGGVCFYWEMRFFFVGGYRRVEGWWEERGK